ncbi:hypothetical protein [Bradyrhizobium sp.]|uniref:hypothetical protein n=1 Tax=Bradyrhizobium sp. TaxID=376 RepID=UPI003C7593D9
MLAGKPATATDANNNTTNFSYDALDRVASVKDAMGRTTSYGYDALSRQISISNLAIQSSPLLQQAYSQDGLLVSLTDANNHATSFAYDGFDRLAITTYPPDGTNTQTTEVLTYDADSNVTTRQTRAGQTISFVYDTLNRLETKTPPSPATAVNFAYDLNNRLTSASDGSAAISAAVPPSGRVDARGDAGTGVLPDHLAEAGNRPVQRAKKIADILCLPRPGPSSGHSIMLFVTQMENSPRQDTRP